MVSVSLRQKRSSATDQNASTPVPTTVTIADAAAASASVRPVSGTPAWARNDHAPGTPRPASPWDEWSIPPKPAALTDTCEITARGVAAVPQPNPHPIEPPTVSTPPEPPTAATPHPALPGFRPWRVDFARPDVVEYPERPVATSPDATTITKRLLLLFGLAYLFLAALTSGLAYTGYFTTTASNNNDADAGRDDRPADPLPHPRPPSRDPDAPGLHTRPDGTRYLVMPLPADLADRFRDRANTIHTVHPARAAHAFGGGAL